MKATKEQERSWREKLHAPCVCVLRAEFHPYAACTMFRQLRDGVKVKANLRFVVAFGMKAQRRGIDLDTAMRDITSVRWADPDEAPNVRTSALPDSSEKE